MMMPTRQGRQVVEELIAPCYSLILTPEEAKVKYPKYVQVMEDLRTRDQQIGVRDVWRCCRRSPAFEDFNVEFKIPVCKTLEWKAEADGGNQYKIVVISAKGPNNFSFQLLSKYREFRDLEEQIQVFYEDKETNYSNAKYVMATGLFEGSFYAAFSQRLRKWVRCISNVDVHVIKHDSLTTLTLIDYACTETLPASRVRPLIKSFTRLPAQGYKASLRISDPQRSISSVALCREFRSVVLGKYFRARVVAYNFSADSAIRFPRVAVDLATLDMKGLVADSDSRDSYHNRMVERNESGTPRIVAGMNDTHSGGGN